MPGARPCSAARLRSGGLQKRQRRKKRQRRSGNNRQPGKAIAYYPKTLVEWLDIAGHSPIFAKPPRGDAPFQSLERLQDAAQNRLFKFWRKTCAQSDILSAVKRSRAPPVGRQTFSSR